MSAVALALHSNGLGYDALKKKKKKPAVLCNTAPLHRNAECIASSVCNTLQPVPFTLKIDTGPM